MVRRRNRITEDELRQKWNEIETIRQHIKYTNINIQRSESELNELYNNLYETNNRTLINTIQGKIDMITDRIRTLKKELQLVERWLREKMASIPTGG